VMVVYLLLGTLFVAGGVSISHTRRLDLTVLLAVLGLIFICCVFSGMRTGLQPSNPPSAVLAPEPGPAGEDAEKQSQTNATPAGRASVSTV